ncbi:hypothetical protein LR48_Vigan10g171100 [Vigna angularis]|uniref:Uncharacterized protein n=1 Tax=Phaseolus angularis TaxID=3914 RepID=A0A0L9VM43_PHAAN|nr:hypothetical protein LR48_Vigan10g171100 [Vigna angularis]
MKRDDRQLALVLVWILIPRANNCAQLTIEDIFLIHALKGHIHTDWAEVVSDTIIKTTRPPMASLPYVVFLSKVFEFYHFSLTDEVSTGYNNTNKNEKAAFHHTGLRKREDGWAFKDEPHADQGEYVDPINVDKSHASPAVRPKNNFEKCVLNEDLDPDAGQEEEEDEQEEQETTDEY